MNEKIFDFIEEYKKITAKECYEIILEDENPKILDNKIGGVPYLPIREKYPTDKEGNHLQLLLQINLKEIQLEGYPNKGILEIFTNTDVDNSCEYIVKYFEEGLKYQKKLPNIDISNNIIKPQRISFKKRICHMPTTYYKYDEIIKYLLNKEYNIDTSILTSQEIQEFFYKYDGENIVLPRKYLSVIISENIISYDYTIGGYGNFIENYPCKDEIKNMEECFFYIGVKIDNSSQKSKGPIYFPDEGEIYGFISNKDLKNCEFDKMLVDWYYID